MYAFIRGKVAFRGEGYLALEAAGVGYKVFVPAKLLEQAKVEEELLLYTYLVVREDELSLYGFFTQQDKAMFEKLIGISGIGPKVAMGVLSAMTAGEIAQAIFAADAKAFSRVGGIGAKTANRIVLELKDKVDIKEALGSGVDNGIGAEETGSRPTAEAVEALMSLGYQKAEALKAVSAVVDLADSAEDLTLLALKRLSR